jgi:hypothetical protein
MGVQIRIYSTSKSKGTFFYHGIDQTFYVKMNKDGRITVPKLNVALIINQLDDEENLFHSAFEVTLDPVF